jgi:hypothetical protein
MENYCTGCRTTYSKEEFGEFRTCTKCRDRRARSKSIDNVIRGYKSGAERRRIEWALTDDQTKTLLYMPCIYCGYHREGFVNGIDRIVNRTGYTSDNSVAACSGCNMLKGDLDVFEFVDRCKQVAACAGGYFGGIKKSPPTFTDGNSRKGASPRAAE